MTTKVLVQSCRTCQRERLSHRKTRGVWYTYICSVCGSTLCKIRRESVLTTKGIERRFLMSDTYVIKLAELSSYELSVFRTLVSSNKIHGIHLVYHLENYMAAMVLKEAWPEKLPLADRVGHFLKYMKTTDNEKEAVFKNLV